MPETMTREELEHARDIFRDYIRHGDSRLPWEHFRALTMKVADTALAAIARAEAAEREQGILKGIMGESVVLPKSALAAGQKEEAERARRVNCMAMELNERVRDAHADRDVWKARSESAERQRDALLARPSAEEYAEGERMQMARAEKAEARLALADKLAEAAGDMLTAFAIVFNDKAPVYDRLAAALSAYKAAKEG